jgi:GT2 family glycosyltransferase
MIKSSASTLYDAYYYAHGCGLPYQPEEPHWSKFFGEIAERIMNDLAPSFVLDAGCAMGFLVHALRARGTEAFGIDISEYAISKALPEIKAFCRVRSVTNPLPRNYDLIICVEVLEHLLPADSERAVANLCAFTGDILFSSSPDDYKEATHFNVQPPDYWADLFARHGFYRDLEYNASYIAPWAVRFRKSRQPFGKIVRAYERKIWFIEKEIQGGRVLTLEQRNELAEKEARLGQMCVQIERLESELKERAALVNRLAEENAKAVQALIDQLPARRQLAQVPAGENDNALQELRQQLIERDHCAREREAEIHVLEAELQRVTQNTLPDGLPGEHARGPASALAARQSSNVVDQIEQLEVQQRLLESCIATKEKVIDSLAAELDWKDTTTIELQRQRQELAEQLRQLRASRAYNLATSLGAWRRRLLPAQTFRQRIASLAFRAFKTWRREGLGAVVGKSVQKIKLKLLSKNVPITPPVPSTKISEALDPIYAEWIEFHEPSHDDLQKQREVRFDLQPKISVVVPVYNTPLVFLTAMIESVLNQTYSNWELCLADGASQDPAIIETLERYARQDARIRCKLLPQNLGIAGNSNQAMAMATGDFVALLDHDDTLAPFALYELVAALNRIPGADFLFSDEDKIDSSGQQRSQPHFKPDWSPDALRHHNYICHLACFKRSLLSKLVGFAAGFDGSQDYDLILRATEQAERIVHIPKVLYHWRMHQASCATAPEVKLYAYQSAKKAIREHLQRCGLKAQVKDGRTLGVYEVVYEIEQPPLISVVIPNRDNHRLLDRCLRSLSRSEYSNYEVIIVENDSRDPQTFDYYASLNKEQHKVVRWSGEFNYSSVNNFGAQQAQGDVLLFLNNDIEAISPDWMKRMLEYAQRKDVGAVGAKLYYPDDTVQHGGVIIGLGGIAGHSHVRCPRNLYGYFGRLIIAQNLSAVTGACLMMRRRVFDDLGGFDERYALAFNDVDLCARIRRKGYLIVWTPFAELYHHESVTRGSDDTPEKLNRFIQEAQLFATDWADLLAAGDPYYNPNQTLWRPDFSLRMAPEGDWKLSDFLRTSIRGKPRLVA